MASSNIGLRPTQAVTEDFGGIVQQGVQGLMAVEEYKREQADKERQRMLEFEDRYGLPEELLYLPETEFRSVNDAGVEAVSQYRDRYYEVYKQLQADPTNIELKKRLQTLKGGVQQLQSTHTKMQELGQKYLEMIENDQISDVHADKWRSILEAYDEGNIRMRVNDKDSLELLVYDKDGKIQDVKRYRDLLNEDLIKKNDVEETLDAMSKRLGADKKTVNEGEWMVTRNEFGTKQAVTAAREIDAYVNNERVMADLYQQLVDKDSRQESGFSDEQKQQVKAVMLERLKGRYGEEVQRVANPYALQAMRDASADKRAKLKDDKDKPNLMVNTQDGKPQVDDKGNIYFSLDKPAPINATKSNTRVKSLVLDNKNRINFVVEREQKVKDVPPGVTPQNASAYGFLVDMDGDKVTYYKTVEEPVAYDATTVNAFAARNGFGDEDKLMAQMQAIIAERFPGMSADLQRRSDAIKQAGSIEMNQEGEAPAEQPAEQAPAPKKKFG